MALYACGSNGSGQLGLGNTEDQYRFVEVMSLQKQPLVAGGGNHTVLVADGKAYVSGTLVKTSTSEFTSITHPENRAWLHCGAGWEFLALGDDKSVYVLGIGKRGELGLGSSTHSAANLTKVYEFDGSIATISCGPSHTVVTLENGELYGWGYNRLGALGLNEKIVPSPKKLTKTASMAVCGRDYTLYLSQGTAHGWGKRVANVDVGRAKQVYAGWSFYGIGLDNGLVRWEGNNAFQQLAAPQGLEKVSVGSEHGIGIMDNSVVTWGWGEHGNCPPPFKCSGAAAVYGGCATSWVWMSHENS